jgi:MYXO-CTERM domain-containing protein
MRVARRTASLALLALCLAVPGAARSHWCDDNWGSSYNLVVRPESDTITVPGSVNVYVQNNMGEALKNFSLSASGGSGCNINIGAASGVRAGYLMPGESIRHTLTFSGSNCGTDIGGVSFSVTFGDGGQSGQYPYGSGKDVVIKKSTGLVPTGSGTGWPGINSGNFQARHLYKSTRADYADAGAGFDDLVALYCAGRGSWDGSGNPYTARCPDSTAGAPTCSGVTVPGTENGSKYDFQQLWGAAYLASKKPVLTQSAHAARLTKFRKGLQCGWNDGHTVFKYLAGFALGYLGEDATARTFLQGKISGGGNDGLVAKAALLMFGNSTDRTSYHADVVAGLGNSDDRVVAVCAAVLGIIDTDDSAVQTYLFPRADWTCPQDDCGTPDEGTKIFGAHLLMMVAWSRRGYAANAADTGAVSFYGAIAPDTTPPKAPEGVSCTAYAGGTVRVQWNQVTQDVNNNSENVAEYRVYSGNSARTSGCTDPGCATDYDHYDSVNGSTFRRDFTGLDGSQTYYFAVMAADASSNLSHYSTEVHCTPIYAPSAVISCTPTSGDAPLAVSCNATGSSDPNGAADIATKTFSLDGQAATSGNTVDYNFDTAASHVVLLRVTDQGGLSDTDQVTINVSYNGNNPPTAVAGATPTSGQAPLQVAFSSAGSSDPDTGQTLTYAWDFKDGNTSTEQNPTHTFATAGSYDVLLTVTDDFTTPASGFAVVTVDVLGNNPPDVSAATADPLFGPVPLTVHFDASGVTDPDGNNVTFSWDFGDGSALSTAATVDHVYATAGAVTAHLTATDDYVTPASATRSFVINPGGGPIQNQAPDCAAATVTPTQGELPLTVTLDASGCTDPEGNGMTFLWRIPTSLSTEDQVDTAQGQYTFPADAYSVDGSATITLRVTDDAASPMSTSRTFVVTFGAGGGGGRLTSCVCAAAGSSARAPLAFLVLIAAAFGLRRRRR